MLRIGLTGGIGSGKSTVSALLARRGAVIIDSDRIAREVVEPGTPGLAAVVEAFGPQVLTPLGAAAPPGRRGVGPAGAGGGGLRRCGGPPDARRDRSSAGPGPRQGAGRRRAGRRRRRPRRA